MVLWERLTLMMGEGDAAVVSVYRGPSQINHSPLEDDCSTKSVMSAILRGGRVSEVVRARSNVFHSGLGTEVAIPMAKRCSFLFRSLFTCRSIEAYRLHVHASEMWSSR